jgi:hypothetical protein
MLAIISVSSIPPALCVYLHTPHQDQYTSSQHINLIAGVSRAGAGLDGSAAWSCVNNQRCFQRTMRAFDWLLRDVSTCMHPDLASPSSSLHTDCVHACPDACSMCLCGVCTSAQVCACSACPQPDERRAAINPVATFAKMHATPEYLYIMVVCMCSDQAAYAHIGGCQRHSCCGMSLIRLMYRRFFSILASVDLECMHETERWYVYLIYS